MSVASDLPPDVVTRALAGDRMAIAALVDALTPVIQARVARALVRRASGERRDLRQEVADLTQDVFAALFANDGHVLRAWEPARGLSLANFVGLVAQRQVASTMRSGRRDPWRESPGELDTLESASEPVPEPGPQLDSRRTLLRLLDRMRASISPRGLELFQRLYVEEEPIEDVATSLGMTREAIYAWRNRMGKVLQKLAREIDEIRPLDEASSPRTPKGTAPLDG